MNYDLWQAESREPHANLKKLALAEHYEFEH